MDLTHKFRAIIRSPSYKAKLKTVINLDDAIDDLIAKNVLSEEEYKYIWRNDKIRRFDIFLDIITGKPFHILDCYNAFKNLSDKFEPLVEDFVKTEDDLSAVYRRGGFPNLHHSIKRTDLVNDVRNKCRNLQWNRMLVIHGIIGNGKSYLVSSALRNKELVNNSFSNRMFWINVGEHQTDNNVLKPLKRLFKQAVFQTESTLSNYQPEDKDDVICRLSELFSKDELKNALVILDNARCPEVIEAFSLVNCKLIVTTHLKNINNADLIEVNGGFTECEVTQLFASYLSCQVCELDFVKQEISELNDLCKGHPATIALLASYLSARKEEALDSKTCWEYLINVFSSGEITHLSNYDVNVNKFNKALEICINTIGISLRERYNQLSVFPKDTNISSSVLEVLWGSGPNKADSNKIRNIMVQFENRSLVSSFYDNAYIYVLHDLYIHYLKELTKREKKEMHRKLVIRYELCCEERYEDLPNDNYILQYLGYHLLQAEMYDRFERFLDLNFIEWKIKVLGVASTEQDLLVYQEYITRDKKLEKKFNETLKFLQDFRVDLHNMEKGDILQVGLQAQLGGASEVIQRNLNDCIDKLYFYTRISSARRKYTQMYNIGHDISTAVFGSYQRDEQKLLIGTSKGDILMYCAQSQSITERYEGHTSKVFSLEISPDNSSFLSISNDRIANLWKLYKPRNSFDSSDLGIPSSPKTKQNPYFSIFDTKKNTAKPLIYNDPDDFIISASFSRNYAQNNLLVTGTQQGKFIIWDGPCGYIRYSSTKTGLPIKNVMFLNDDKRIIFSKEDNIIHFTSTEINNWTYLEGKHNGDNINFLFLIPHNDYPVAVSDFKIALHCLPSQGSFRTNVIFENRTSAITCAAITKEGRYLAAGTEDYKVYLFELTTGIEGKLIDVLQHTKSIISIFVDTSFEKENQISMILMGFDNKTIQQCNILMQSYDNVKNSEDLVATYWKHKTDPLIAQVNNDVLQIIMEDSNKFTVISEYRQKEIDYVTFSLCGNGVIFVDKNGSVKEFLYRTKEIKEIMKLEGQVSILKCFKDYFDEPDDVFYSTQHLDNGTIVSITKNRSIKILRNLREMTAIWNSDILDIFQMSYSRFIFVDCMGKVVGLSLERIAGLSLENDSMVFSTKYSVPEVKTVTAVTMCSKSQMLAMIYVNESKNMFVGLLDLKMGAGQFVNVMLLNFEAVTCAFSCNGKILAVGGVDGRIKVFRISSTNDISEGPSELSHSAAINFLQFSNRYEPILVSVGGEISWWNLNDMEDMSSNGIFEINDMDEHCWMNKSPHQNIPHLLQSINLYSPTAKYFTVSKDFSTFLTVDDESRIYVMELLPNENFT